MKRNLKYISLLFIVLLASSSLTVAQEKYAKLGETKIHYKNFGTGKDALVLVHCWTCNLELWSEHIPEFSKRARVLALDLPGHGLSDKPQTNYNMDFFAEAVDAVMKDAGVEHAVFVGHSMGTPVIRQYYRKYPQKVLALVIVDGAIRPFGTKEQREQFTAPLRGPQYKEAGVQMFAAMTSTLSAPDKERVRNSFNSTPQYVLVSSMEAMGDDSIYAPDKIKVPVLAILAKSPFWPADTEQYLHGIAPDLTYQMWDGVSHFLFMDRPKEFDAAVIAFLDQKKLLK